LHETVAYTSLERLGELVEACLEGAGAEVRHPPEEALMMVRVREPVDGEIFNLGEVLVTRCEVVLDGEPGWGMAIGGDPTRALYAAVLDAANRRGLRKDIEDDLKLQLAFVRESRRERWARVQATRVELEEMAS
jgi:alpha-D-ribose 1-methylphosphonate 5-triphosphate synthase subunit PhnG